MTTVSLPIQSKTRDEIDASIKEFSRLWPLRTERPASTTHSSSRFDDSRNCTIASNDLNAESAASNYIKRNSALVAVGGVPLQPITLETEPNAWDLPSSTLIENQNRKFFMQHFWFRFCVW